jgi:hypothetical protein
MKGQVLVWFAVVEFADWGTEVFEGGVVLVR